ncbi:MAG: transporter substrate-binding domain-containing protein [Aestuariivirga sp.]
MFRHIDKAALAPQAKLPAAIMLLVDEDFAPFSFKSTEGKLAGISVQLALEACAELKVQCQLQAMPYADLLNALQNKRGDLIIGGPPASATFASTRPYYYSYSQFFVRNGSNFDGVDVKSLAGRRLGFVKGSGQDAFLKKNFDRATLVPFTSEEAMFEALRTGGLDLAFADSLQGAFWLKSHNSRGCCAPFGGAFVDKTTFTHGLVMLTRSNDGALREALDGALDRLQEKGLSAKAFATYLPSSPF